MQKQHGATQFGTLEPVWRPLERFEFVVADPRTTRLVVQLSDQSSCGIDRSRCLGSLKLDDLLETTQQRQVSMLGENAEGEASSRVNVIYSGVERELDLFSAKSGKPWPGAGITVQLALKTKADFFRSVRDVVFEFGALQPGSSIVQDNLKIPGGPAKYANENLQLFADTFSSVAAVVPDGFRVLEDWYVEANGTTGWLYARGFWSKRWETEHFPVAKVARRRWIRILERSDDDTVTDDLEIHALPGSTDAKPSDPPASICLGFCCCCKPKLM